VANIFSTLGKKINAQLDNNLAQVYPVFGGSLGPTNTNPFDTDSLVDFGKTYASYSGTDVTVIAQVNNKLIVLGNLETFSYSVFREKSPVRVLGRSHCKGYTSGSRSIAGSMVFVVFDRAPLYDVIKELNWVRNPTDRNSSPVPDQLPPIDLILLFRNEYGHNSVMRLYGVEFVQEGQVHSIQDLYSENTMQYVARDMDQLTAFQDIKDFKDMMFERQVRGLFIDNNLTSLLDYKKRIEQQLAEVENIIQQVDIETGRRAVAGAFTLSASYWLTQKLGRSLTNEEPVTRSKLNETKDSQTKIRTYLLKELDDTNKRITRYEQGLAGWNAQRPNTGIVANDRGTP
jgi:hypothetical protein